MELRKKLKAAFIELSNHDPYWPEPGCTCSSCDRASTVLADAVIRIVMEEAAKVADARAKEHAKIGKKMKRQGWIEEPAFYDTIAREAEILADELRRIAQLEPASK